MALYPSLEDMKVDQMIKAQVELTSKYISNEPMYIPSCPSEPSASPAPSAPALTLPRSGQLYPALNDYMGLEFSPQMIAENMPEYLTTHSDNMTVATSTNNGQFSGMIAPISGNAVGFQKAHVTNGVRELTLCKDKNGEIGIRVHAIDNGIFVCLVNVNSPAAKAGLRFGDQILDINGTSVAGYSMKQVHKMMRNAPINNIKVIVRDRPFERTVTMNKDSTGNVGFHFKNGRITALVKDLSAAKNGLLTDHQILEVNGKNVIGMKDKSIAAEIANSDNVVIVTVIPSYIYDHIIKKMNPSLLKSMDHSSNM